MSIRITFTVFLFLKLSCAVGQFTVNCYNVLDSTISNPDRGLTMYFNFGGTYKTLLRDYPAGSSLKTIDKLKQEKYSLVMMNCILTNFKTQPISNGFLDSLASNFQTLRSNGLKCVLMFYYDVGGAVSYEPDLQKILSDIVALKPVLRQNQDVIMLMKSGFIGPWGEEWTSSNHQFGATYKENGVALINQAHYSDRKMILDSVLNIYSDNKIIATRTPLLKMNMFNKCYTDSITAATAYGSNDYFRVGYFNDGLLSSTDDYGTWQWGMPMYNNCSPTTTNTVSDGAKGLKMLQTESRYTVCGGESAAPRYGYVPKCTTSVAHMRNLHISFLNSEWYGPTLNIWKNEGCFSDMEKNVGYRFHLDSTTYFQKMQKNNSYNIKMYLTNLGYASTIYKKNVSLVFRRLENGWIYKFPLPAIDTRKWYANEQVVIDHNFPTNVLYGGTYDIYLEISDQSESLKNNKKYNVRLSSEGIWDPLMAMNKLNKVPCYIYWKETPGVIPTDTVRYCQTQGLSKTSSLTTNQSVFMQKSEVSLNIYPNPNSGNFFVTFRIDDDEPSELSIFDSRGKIVYKKSIEGKGDHEEKISISKDGVGAFMIYLRTKKGVIANKTVVVK